MNCIRECALLRPTCTSSTKRTPPSRHPPSHTSIHPRPGPSLSPSQQAHLQTLRVVRVRILASAPSLTALRPLKTRITTALRVLSRTRPARGRRRRSRGCRGCRRRLGRRLARRGRAGGRHFACGDGSSRRGGLGGCGGWGSWVGALGCGGENWYVVVEGDAAAGLEAVNVGFPPGAGGPPEGTLPDVCASHYHQYGSLNGREEEEGERTSVRLHVSKHALHSSLALGVHASSELADNANFAVCAQPVGGCYEALGAYGGGDAGSGRARAVGVEVLVHLVDEVVAGVGEGAHRVAVGWSVGKGKEGTGWDGEETNALV